MSRESTPVRYQRDYSIWDAVADNEISSVDVDAKGQVDVDEQLNRIFGADGPRDGAPMMSPGSPRPPRSPYTSPRASPVRLRPILANCGPAPFQRQVKPRLPSSHPPAPNPPADPAIKLLGDEIRVLEERNRALYKRVVVQNKIIVGFCEQEVLFAGKENGSRAKPQASMERQRLVPVVPQLLRRDGRVQLVEPLKSSGFEISPTIATVSMFQMLAFLAYAVAPSPYVMATVSNMCYMGAGLYRAIISLTRGHSSAFLLGQLAGASFVYVFLGSSSFAFHAESVLNSPAHSFDILGGWLLVFHVCFVCVAVCVIALVKWCMHYKSDTFAVTTTQILLSIVLIGSFTMLMTFYSSFYGRQLELYFVLGPSAALFGSICRFMLVYDKKDLQWRAVRIAAFELGVGLTTVFSAILCQGELLSLTNRKLSYNQEGDAYDLYHAHWHYFLALSTAVLYSRAADASRVVMGTHRVCVCAQSWLDVFALVVLFVYAVTAVILKEGRSDTKTSLTILFGFNALLMLHAMLTLMDWLKRRRDLVMVEVV